MAMSYCKLIQLRQALKYFHRSLSSLPSTKPAGLTQASKTNNKTSLEEKKETRIVVEEKKEKGVSFELPKDPPRTERYTTFELFNSDTNLAINVISALNSVTFTPYGLKKAWSEIQTNKLLHSQMYIKERAEFLGPELATAHFVLFRGGKVRFHGETEWIAKDPDSDLIENIPNIYVDYMKVEAVDCSKMPLIYEGLENMKLMESLKWLSVESCPHIDDWCLDRIAGEYGHSLEYLNIRDCPKVTEKGIASLSKLKKLKTLVLGGHPKAQHLELVCLMLEDALPNLTVKGIIYCDESFLKPQDAE